MPSGVNAGDSSAASAYGSQPCGVAPLSDRGPAAAQAVEPGGQAGLGHHVPDVAARYPVGEVGRTEQRAGRDDNHPELHRRQDDLPQRRDVAQHQQQPVAAAGPEFAQPVGNLAGPGGQLAVAEAGGGVAVGHDPQCGPVGVLGRDHIEPVQRPVELLQRGPGELTSGRRVVVAVPQQQVTGGPEGGRRRVWLSHGVHRRRCGPPADTHGRGLMLAPPVGVVQGRRPGRPE
jgi:hypothetical protein